MPAEATFVVWGDSHAYRLATALDTMAAAQHAGGVLLTIGGCPPLPGAVGSPIMNLHRLRQVGRCGPPRLSESRPALRTVILSAIWALYPEGAKVGQAGGLDHPLLTDAQSRGYSIEESRCASRSFVSVYKDW